MVAKLSYAEARHILSGNIDGKRLPLIEFVDAQQDEVERLTGERNRAYKGLVALYEEIVRHQTAKEQLRRDVEVLSRDRDKLARLVEAAPHSPRPDAEALAAVPSLKSARALVLYFPTDADRDEFVALIHEAKPNMRSVKL